MRTVLRQPYSKNNLETSCLLYRIKKYRYLCLLIAPGILFFIFFKYLPMYGILLAFKDYKFSDGIIGSEWIGFEVFRQMFGMRDFWEVFRNTLYLGIGKLIIGFPAPIVFALMLNEIKNGMFKKTVQTVSFLPYFVSWVVLAGLFFEFLSPSTGPVNYILNLLTGKTYYFLGDPAYFRPTMVILHVWKNMGWSAIIYLAALASINPRLYEAAKIDGAGRLQQVFRITIPSLKPVIVIMLILSVGFILEDDFDQIFNFLRPTTYAVGDVLSTYTFKKGLQYGKYELATAVGLFQNGISLVLLYITNRITKSFSEFGVL